MTEVVATSSVEPVATQSCTIRDAYVQFGGGPSPVRAVDGVDLDVGRGEVLALVGESGCGKTTLIRSIIGLEPLDQWHDRRSRAQASAPSARALRELRQRVQMIFQDPSGALNPRHTIYEAVAEGLRIHKVTGHEPTLVADALARAGLRPPERYLRRYPHEVSGGQRQRVLIAAAMALGPQLLLADEPVASLDASIRGEILALMRSFVDEHGVSIIAVTHDLGSGLEHRRPGRGDVPGPHRRDRPDRGGARRPAASRTRVRCSAWCPRSGRWSSRS